MVKKLMVLILALVMLVSLSAACTGPAGSAGATGPAGLAGPAGPVGEPGVPGSTARLVVTPASGTATTPIAISGAGFVPGETVELILEISGVETLLGERDAKGLIVANEYGAFRATSRIPRVIATGAYVIQASGDKGTTAFCPIEITE